MTSSSKIFNVITTSQFRKEAKTLKKKFPNIGNDIGALNAKLKLDPITGNDSLGKDCFKVRMSISDKGKGERGGARLIIQVKIEGRNVYILSIYDKTTRDTYTKNEIARLIQAKIEEFGG